MTAYSVIARYLLDEASSGTSPTTVADDTGNDNGLTIDYSSGDAAWNSESGGNGLDFTAAIETTDSAIAELADIVNNGNLGSSFDGATELSMIVRVTIDNSSGDGSRIFGIGTSSGNGDIAIVGGGTTLNVRFDSEDDGVEVTYTGVPSGITTIAVVIDSTDGTAADRIRTHLDGSATPLTAASGVLTQNVAMDDINNTSRSAYIGNRPSQNRNIDGKVWYAEIGTGQLTTTEIADAHTALSSDHDSDWAAAASAAITGTMTATVDEDDLTGGGKTVIVTVTGDTFKAAGTGPIGSIADTQALIDGFDAASSPTNGWNNEVRDKAATTEVVRTSSTIATWTVAAQAGYDVSAQEVITGTIPTAVLVTGAGAITATPTFTIDEVVVATPTVTDVNTNEETVDAEQNVTFTTSDFDSEITTFKLKSGTAITSATSINSTSGDGDCDFPDVAAFVIDTLGCPFTSANNTVVYELSDGTDTDDLAAVDYGPKSGWAIVEVASAVKTAGSVFEDFVGTIVDESEVYYPTADTTSVAADGIITTNSLVDIDMLFWDKSDETWKPFTGFLTTDTTPDAFSFTDQTDVDASTVIMSNIITVLGINASTATSITTSDGAEYRINGGSWISTASSVVLNDTVQLRVTSSASPSTAVTGTMDIGGVTDEWSVTTEAVPADTIPDPFVFTAQANIALSTVTLSNIITVTGIDASTTTSIATSDGMEYRINGGSWIATPSSVVVNDTVQLRVTSSASYSTQVAGTMNIGGVTDEWTVTTMVDPATTIALVSGISLALGLSL